jgi:hypothetical protein
MASPANTRTGDKVDFGRSLGFVFEDPEWLKKMLLGGLFALLGMVLIGTILVGGYFLRVIRRTASGEARPLPDWDDWGGLLVDGLVAFGVYLVHIVALVVPLLLGGGCLLGLAAAAGGAGEKAGAATGAVAAVGVLGLYAVVLLLGLALAVYIPAVLTRVAVLGRFGVAFEVRENVGFIRRNLGEYLLALVIFLVASFISQFGVILLCVGIFPASFWSYCVLAFPLGQIARRDPVLGAAPRA